MDTFINETDMSLYKDCEYFDEFELWVYSPKIDLDIELFYSIINSELLKKSIILNKGSHGDLKINIIVNKDQNRTFFFHSEQCSVENINYYDLDLESIKCDECGLVLPFDLNFYSNNIQNEKFNLDCYKCDFNNKNGLIDKYNICYICYNNCIIQKSNLNSVKIPTGLDNISGWIEIFTIMTTYE